mmetsp:Transcript_20587/g.64332  ORF Transcript_20587/g.64332 Transcript_20587/m.64332 type:complete len:208 (+) Transcript_20587:148-771(+)
MLPRLRPRLQRVRRSLEFRPRRQKRQAKPLQPPWQLPGHGQMLERSCWRRARPPRSWHRSSRRLPSRRQSRSRRPCRPLRSPKLRPKLVPGRPRRQRRKVETPALKARRWRPRLPVWPPRSPQLKLRRRVRPSARLPHPQSLQPRPRQPRRPACRATSASQSPRSPPCRQASRRWPWPWREPWQCPRARQRAWPSWRPMRMPKPAWP